MRQLQLWEAHGVRYAREVHDRCVFWWSALQVSVRLWVVCVVGNVFDGGLGQYVTVPVTGVCPAPDDVDPAELAPLLCAGLTVYSTCHDVLSSATFANPDTHYP